MRLTAAIDAGGTKIAGALVDQENRLRWRIEEPTPMVDGARDPGLATVVEVALRLEAEADRRGAKLDGLGVGLPEYVADGVVQGRDVLAWDRQPAELLAAALPGECGVPGVPGLPGVPVTVESDVRLGALAEWKLGAGVSAGADSMVYVSWGTGLSSAFATSAGVWPGSQGRAIALGELRVDSGVDPAWDGNLEAYASGHGIARRFEQLTGAPAGAGARHVAEACAGGDATARRVLTSAGRAVGHAIAAAVFLLDPALIVVGGGFGLADTPAVHAAHEAYTQLVIATHRTAPRWLPAGCGTDAGLLGAALAARS
ncbi:MAG: ROK family protein [Bifidobacteriaceae bacterium]|jgi:glucokinase|nr:ROK family protein [Bifidobacteriaceae bacterium]